MDERLRDLERRAKGGDLNAAIGWYRELCRVDDQNYGVILEAMKLMGELQHPGLFETLKMLEETQKLIQMPPVEDGYWTTEVHLINNTGP